jgi:hypothetical protein
MPPHRHYVEPYFGSGRVLFARDPQDRRLWLAETSSQRGVSELVNDLDGQLVNFWGDLIICPTNAPIVQGCLRLIAQRRPAHVRGRDVGMQLVSILRGVGTCKTIAECARGVETWRARELDRLRLLDGVEDVIESVNDRAAGLQAVLESCTSPADAEPLIGQLFSDERRGDSVCFSTIHRAKGDEARTVWLIDAPVRRPQREWEVRQQRNLCYVGLTRSKHSLRFVNGRDQG